MEAIIKFVLPEESDAHQTALDGGKWKSALEELDQWLRGLYKYGDSKTVDIEEARAKIREIADESGLRLD